MGNVSVILVTPGRSVVPRVVQKTAAVEENVRVVSAYVRRDSAAQTAHWKQQKYLRSSGFK